MSAISSNLSVEELVGLVHRYYPAGLENDDPRYESSPEIQRLHALLEPLRQDLRAGRKEPKWDRFVTRLCQEFDGCIVWDTTPPLSEPCYSCRVYLPWVTMGSEDAHAVAILLSLLAPVYAIYALSEGSEAWVKFPPLPAAFQAHESRLAEMVESEYGFTRLPNDVLFTPVPDISPWASNISLGEARLIDCLLSRYL